MHKRFLFLAFVLLSPFRVMAGEQGPFQNSIEGAATPPPGFVEFCKRKPSECRKDTSPKYRRVTLSKRVIADLATINTSVNMEIQPVLDSITYKKSDYWALPSESPTGRSGDCEDYALLKRHLLIKKGWPVSSVLVAVVLDKKQFHAVLIVRTDRGDLVLDNKENLVRTWDKVGYKFLMRQSTADPKRWVALDKSYALKKTWLVVTSQP